MYAEKLDQHNHPTTQKAYQRSIITVTTERLRAVSRPRLRYFSLFFVGYAIVVHQMMQVLGQKCGFIEVPVVVVGPFQSLLIRSLFFDLM